jgi:hypothetical protein
MCDLTNICKLFSYIAQPFIDKECRQIMIVLDEKRVIILLLYISQILKYIAKIVIVVIVIPVY